MQSMRLFLAHQLAPTPELAPLDPPDITVSLHAGFPLRCSREFTAPSRERLSLCTSLQKWFYKYTYRNLQICTGCGHWTYSAALSWPSLCVGACLSPPGGPTFHKARVSTSFLCFQCRDEDLLSHARYSLRMWYNGLSLNNLRPVAPEDDHKEVLEVCSLIPEGTNSSIFVELTDSTIDPTAK